jgi:hypothetical protein
MGVLLWMIYREKESALGNEQLAEAGRS